MRNSQPGQRPHAGWLRRPFQIHLLCETLEDRTLLDGSALATLNSPRLIIDPGAHAASSILVRFRSEATVQIAQGTDPGPEMSLVRGMHTVKLGAGVTVDAALAAYRANPNVLYAEPDYSVHLLETPNDPQFASQWALNNTGQTGGLAGADIHAPAAWDVTPGSGGTIVALIDTGVDYTHPDLAANIWTNPGEIAGNGIDDDHDGYIDDVHGYDFVNNDSDPMDDNTHGTHVAGTLGAVGNNGIGITGVNWHVQIMALKALDAQGNGTLSSILGALSYAVAHGAKVANNSYGGGLYSQAFADAIQSTGDAGLIFVAAAGNGNAMGVGQNNDTSPFYPASYNLPNVVAVAASDQSDNLASFSNYGAASVDLAAPGVNILSTLPNNTYGVYSGTSMATPHVTGVLALVRDLHPTWTSAAVINQVLDAVDVLPSLQGKTITGGRLNAARAVAPLSAIDLSWPASALSGPLTGDWLTPFTLSRTYTISGEAASASVTISYYASTDTILGNSDDVLIGSETLSASPDRSVGSHSGTSPALLVPTDGSFYLFAQLDTANSIYEIHEANNVSRTADPIVVAGPVIVDNRDVGYTETGPGWADWAAGYGGGLRYQAAGSGASTATWQATGLRVGDYLVQATWNSAPNHPSNAPFAIYDGDTLLKTVLVDQRSEPSGALVGGVSFQGLATVRITSGTLRVVLSDNADGFVVADAVRFVPISPVLDLNWSGGGIVGPQIVNTQTSFTVDRAYAVSGEVAPASFTIAYYASTDAVFGNSDDLLLATETVSPADATVGLHSGVSPALLLPTAGQYFLFARLDTQNTLLETDEGNNLAGTGQPVTVTAPMILDDGQSGYAETGSGWAGWAAGYNGSLRYHAAGTGADAAIWQVSGLAAGYYLIQATWNGASNHPSNAPYSIYDGSILRTTVLVDQRTAPTGVVVGGVAFQDLASVQVTSGTLQVMLSDNANGYIVADAIRVVQRTVPLVDLSWFGGGITGPTAITSQTPFTISRTYTVSGAPVTGSFTIAYYAYGDATLGNGDDIWLGSETISAAVAKSVGSHSGTSPALVLSGGGTYYLFARLDSGAAVLETDETNNIAQTAQPVTVTGPMVLDNGGPGYSETGSAWAGWAAGYNGGLRYHAAGSGADTAAWQIAGLPAGYYTVQATWNAASNHSSNAPYRIYDGNTLLRTIFVDQRSDPTGIVVGGVVFQNLASVQVTSGTLRVVLADSGDGYVVADAVRLEPMPPPVADVNWSAGGISGPSSVLAQVPFNLSRTYTVSGTALPGSFTITYYASTDAILGNGDDILLGSETLGSSNDTSVGSHSGSSPALVLSGGGTYYLFARLDSGDAVLETDETNNIAQTAQPVTVTGPVVLDNGGPGYSETGSGWASWAAGYNGGLGYHAAGSGSNTAAWQLAGLPVGSYTVQATWNAASNHASNASYSIYDGNTLLLTVRVDQRPAPSGTLAGGVAFQNLATVQITSGTLRVVLSDNADGYIVADAVRVMPVDPGSGAIAGLGEPVRTLAVTPPTASGLSRQDAAAASVPGAELEAFVESRFAGLLPLDAAPPNQGDTPTGRQPEATGDSDTREARPEVRRAGGPRDRRHGRGGSTATDETFDDVSG